MWKILIRSLKGPETVNSGLWINSLFITDIFIILDADVFVKQNINELYVAAFWNKPFEFKRLLL